MGVNGQGRRVDRAGASSARAQTARIDAQQSRPHASLAVAAGGAALLVIAAVAAGCATAPAVDYDKVALDMMKARSATQGQAEVERLQQDEAQRICSGRRRRRRPTRGKRIETAELATIKCPPSGRYLGDWREGEKLAQNGRGMTWSDPAGAPAGGNCYNCHQIEQGRDLVRHDRPEPLQLRQAARRAGPGRSGIGADRRVHLGQDLEREGLQRLLRACRASATRRC